MYGENAMSLGRLKQDTKKPSGGELAAEENETVIQAE